jgi:large subunit ribosomal protein L15
MMRLHNLRPRPGARHRVKRLGCGESSGHGKTSGKGHKGQKARSGGSIRLGFEGGQMPLIRRLPKRGFNNAAFHKNYAIVNLTDLNEFKAGTVVDEKLLREANLVRGNVFGIKLLGDGELKHALKIEVDKVSDSAKAKIDQAGGTITIRERRVPGVDQEKADETTAVKAAAPASKKSTTGSRAKAKKKTSRKG